MSTGSSEAVAPSRPVVETARERQPPPGVEGARVFGRAVIAHPYLAVFCVALLARLAAVAALNFLPFQGRVFAADSDFYVRLALVLAGNGDPPKPNINLSQWIFGGYLGLLYSITETWGDPIRWGSIAVGIGNALLGSVSAVLVARSAHLVFGQAAGFAAGLVAGVTPYSLFWTPYVLREPLGAFLVASAMFLVLAFLSRRTIRRGVQALMASAVLLVYPYLVAVPMAAISFGFIARHTLKPWPRIWRGTYLLIGLSLVFWLMVPAPGVLGQLRGRTLAMGAEQLYSNFGPGQTAATSGYWERNTVVPAHLAVGLSATEFSRVLTPEQRAGIWVSLFAQHLLAQPGEVLALVPPKLYNMWRPSWEGSSPRNLFLLGGGYVITLSLALAGVLRANWRDSRVVYLLAVIGAFVVFHVYTYGMIRFREYPMQLVLVFAGPGAASLFQWARSHGRNSPPRNGLK